MLKSFLVYTTFILFVLNTYAQTNNSITENLVDNDDFKFLKELAKDVLESSRVYAHQKITSDSIPNNTGGILIRPGGRDTYPSFWIRDYAMSLESGFISEEEQKHMLQLTASTQCDQTWITQGGSMVPVGAIADHIRIDDLLPIYFPGTYSYEEQGKELFGMTPPYGDQFFFIHMAYCYLKLTSDYEILLKEINGIPLIDRLELAFKVPPTRNDSHIVYTTDNFRGVDFGFHDLIRITGDLCYPSILKFRAATQMAEIYEILNKKDKAESYRIISGKIKSAIPELFLDQRGMLLASTGISDQPDVWSTALAVYYNILDDEAMKTTCRFLADAYEKGLLSYRGNIRHVLTSDDFSNSTAWAVTGGIKKGTYQNGAYWGTPVGWVCYAIAQVEPDLAKKLLGEYINELRENDFRKGEEYGAPYECFNQSGYNQNPVYLTSVTCPFIVLNSNLIED